MDVSLSTASVRNSRTDVAPKTARTMISAIIPTVGTRASELHNAVRSVLRQESPFDVEVIVVNDSGAPLPFAPWQALDAVQIIQTGRGWTGLPNARNTGAAAARGEYLYFLDDDDEVLDGGFAAFADALKAHPGADWLHGGTERWTRAGDYIDTLPIGSNGNVIAELFSGEWMPVQSCLVNVDLFHRVGGFDIRFRASEDMDFIMRVSMKSDKVLVKTPVCKYHLGLEQSVARRGLDVPYLYKAYEKVLDHPGSLHRLRHSATTAHLYGKITRIYLISVKRHARNGHYHKMIGRLIDAMAVIGGGGRFLFQPAFWRSLWSDRAGATPPSTAQSTAIMGE